MCLFEGFNLQAPGSRPTQLLADEIVPPEDLEMARQIALESQPEVERSHEGEGSELQTGEAHSGSSTTTNTKKRSRKAQRNFDRERRLRRKDEKGQPLKASKEVPIALQHSRHLQQGRLVRTQVDAEAELKHTKPAFKGKLITPTELKDMKRVAYTEVFEYIPSYPG